MHYVIIGNGIAGISAAQVIRERDEDSQITIIGDESKHFYARTALMWAYTGQLSRRDLEPFERRYWSENRFDLIADQVVSIDAEKRNLSLDKSGPIAYDKLLLATGSVANLFGWPGQDLEGVCTFTTLPDLDRLDSWQGKVKQAVVIGGGLVGIELVEILLHDGVEVTYLIREPWYFNLMLSKPEADLVHKKLIKEGAQVIYNDEIQEIRGDGGTVTSLLTKQGSEIPCGLVAIAVGVHPRTDLAKNSAIECGRGIVVDRSFRTSVPDVWAAGDCAEIREPDQDKGLIQALWYTANKQGIQVGRAMVGDEIHYDPGIPYNSAQFLFLDYVTVGWTKHLNPELTEYEWLDQDQEHAVRIAYDESERVKGFSLLGPRYRAATLMRWIEEGRKLAYVRKRLAQAAYNEEFSPVMRKGLTYV
ncbi:NAD(P)/FAD-dependent oxidoreductase [candidate division CSSED10-310 bacterium]|uniref:NAD(P)/FAD-dependent oxidoreductase n=1 Tax=candidate division CSSED10-310 bacterium TaxID=2855610 RepID=A0ABV6YYK9_UNCC1